MPNLSDDNTNHRCFFGTKTFQHIMKDESGVPVRSKISSPEGSRKAYLQFHSIASNLQFSDYDEFHPDISFGDCGISR